MLSPNSYWRKYKLGDVVEYSSDNFKEEIYSGKIREMYSDHIAIEAMTPKHCRIVVYDTDSGKRSVRLKT